MLVFPPTLWRVQVVPRRSLLRAQLVPRRSRRTLYLDSVCLGSARILNELDMTAEEKRRKLASEFKALCSWRTKEDLSTQLIQDIVYFNPEDKAGLLALSKPYGLPIYPSEDCTYSLESCLPDISTHLGVEKLSIVKGVDRYCSGVTLISTNKNTKEHLQKVRERLRAARQLGEGYLALVSGHADLHGQDTFRVHLKEFPDMPNPLFSKVAKEPVIVSGMSTPIKRFKSGEKLRHVSYRTLGRSSTLPLSLLAVNPSSVKNHLIRVYLAHRGFPVLGDGLYDYRVKTVLGQKIQRGPEHSQTNRCQVLPQSVLTKFGLEKGEVWRIPTFLHHWRTFLPGWLGKGQDLTIFAPPPRHYAKTLSEVKIKFDFEEFIKTENIDVFEPEDKKKKKKKQEWIE